MPTAPRPSLVPAALVLLVSGAAALLPGSAGAAIYYVGTGTTCDGANDRPSLGAALLSAAFTTANDEIRLTRTLTYTNVALDLVDWHAGVAGTVTIAGGYDNCDDTAASGRIALNGQSGNSVVVVRTSSQSSSVVTLRALELTDSGFRGLAVGSGAEVSLQNVWIHHNGGGAFVSTGGFLTTDAATEVTDHAPFYDYGGGISCSGAGAYLGFRGKLLRNQVLEGGGNLHVGPGCLVELYGGVLLEGNGAFPSVDYSASFGGAIYVDNGIVVAHGGANQVMIRQHQVYADGRGGAIFARGADAVVSLFNTAIQNNTARISGAALHAEDGASVAMDRVAPCPFIFSCSDIRNNRTIGSWDGHLVSIDGAHVELRRTVVVGNGWQSTFLAAPSNLLHVENDGYLALDGVLLWRNFAAHLLHAISGGEITGQYLTVAENTYSIDSVVYDSWASIADGGDVGLFSSILLDTKGTDTLAGGSTTSDCLLVNTTQNWNPGTFFVAAPLFISQGTGDLRQVAGSPGVDFCDEQMVPWPGQLDVERRPRGYDEGTNPNGVPGISGGRFDAGFSEHVPAGYLFADGFATGDTTAWSSTAN
jgi:hypothetical protein